MDVYSLTDEELLHQLRLHNIQCGPILDSTRRIYQKKLTKVLQDGPSEPDSQADTMPVDELDFSDQYEEEPEPEPVPVKKRTAEPRDVRQRVVKQPQEPVYSRIAREEPREQHTTYTKTTYSTQTREEAAPLSAADLVTQAPESTEEPPKKGGMSIWVQLLIVLIVAFLIFLVFQNMEPAGKAPPRRLEQEPDV